MSLTSRFKGPKTERNFALQRREHRPRRQPTRSRPSLEYLEERTLLDASSGLIGGATNNLALNSNFNLASNGVILPTPGFSTGSSTANGANAAHSLDFSGLASGGTSAQAASSAFLAQNQPSAQFRLFAVNSQGQDFQLFQQSQLNFLANVYGFGSGTQPTRPWMPAAYNVGLANRQFSFASQADIGFQTPPPYSYPEPGTVPLAQAQPKHQQQRLGEEDGREAEVSGTVLVRKSMTEEQQSQQRRTEKTISDENEDSKAAMEKESAKALPEDQVLQKDLAMPNSLWLSVLAPAPVTALVAGLPGAVGEAEGGEVSAEAAE